MMEGFTAAINGVLTVVGSVFDFVVGEPILLTIFGAGFVGSVIGIVHKFKR